MFSRIMASLLLSVLLLTSGVSQAGTFGPRSCDEFGGNGKDYDGFGYDERRGSPADFDPGPDSLDKESWLKLFGQIPNYRQLGRYMMKADTEVFRWVMGPMWYRGRLGKNEVKVFVVGQEGAQDENITNRAFTGSTGTRVQKFLNHLGIYESYLFLNTFVYTLNFFEIGKKSNGGQRITSDNDLAEYEPNYVAIEQVWQSPLVQYRNSLFDNVVFQNPDSLKLIMAVGGGAKDSLATWINSRSGNTNCNENKINECDLTAFYAYFESKGIKIKNQLRALDVVHPGSAKFPGGMSNVLRSFNEAAGTARSIDLEADPQESQFAHCSGGTLAGRLKSGFKYGYAPVPFKDFSFGTNWRNGKAGTSSNRHGADKILIFSEKGDYDESKPSSAPRVMNFEGNNSPKASLAQLRDEKKGLIDGMNDNEVPYEHPRYSNWGEATGDLDHVKQFDPGPSSKRIAQALVDWPNFKEIDQKAFVSDPSFGFGPTYRGNTKDPRYVIIADQMSHTDMFSTRALTGAGGQYLQTFLNRYLKGQYLILRSLPIDTLGVGTAEVINLATKPDNSGKSAVDTLKGIFSTLPKRLKVFTVGPVAQAMAKAAQISSVELEPPKHNLSHTEQWVQVARKTNLFKGLDVLIERDKLRAMQAIPRSDLPYSTRWWMGTTGDSGSRGEAKKSGDEGKYKGHYYRLEAPKWVNSKLRYDDPRPLTDKEKEAADEALEFMGI